VAKRDGDGERARPVSCWCAIKVPDKLGEQIVRMQLRDDGLHELAGPPKAFRMRRELSQRTRTQLRPPALGIELLFGSSGFFEPVIDVS
jgi:hypothetical protein